MKSDIQKALKLYRTGRYTKVLRLLEPQVFRYRETFTFFYLLGMSCLRTGDSGGAKTYLDRALGIKPNDPKSLAGLAVVHLKRYEVSDAIQCYLDISDEDPHHPLARRGLKLLKRNADREQLAPIIDSGKVDSLLPRERSRKRSILLLLLFITAVSVISGYTLFRLQNRRPPRQAEVASLSLQDIQQLATTDDQSEFALTEREIERAFSNAKRYFAEFHDNLALRELNRLLRSNASEAVKEQARTIATFIHAPDFTTLTNSFSYETVAADPTLYNGTYVAWKGRTSNLSIGPEHILFDLLVGYDTNQVLEGVVPVQLDFAVDLADGGPIEVLGEVAGTKTGFSLHAISIHKLAEQSK